MNQYFIESKQPIFVNFNRRIENSATDLDFGLLLISNFQENFEKLQQKSWLQFWHEQGEEEVLQNWNKKYKNYLKDQDCLTEAETKHIEEEDINTSEVTCEANENLPETTWQDLWKEHREKIYCEKYQLFTTIFYNYFLDLQKSCECLQSDEDETQEELANQLESIQLTQELDQLDNLGLPTAFTGRQQNSSKTNKKSTIYYSGLFSNSEMENEYNDSDTDTEDCDNYLAVDVEKSASFLHNVQQKSSSKIQRRKRKKKGNRKLKNVPSFILEEKGLLKYWYKRFSLFSRYDEGIRLDRESWFSVTPEKVAKHLAERLKSSIIVDGFCGSGGNAIQFALTCEKVIAIDIDPIKIEMAKHNAEIYKVSHKIEFIVGDFLQLAVSGKLKTDVVFLSPPWGGPKYKKINQFDIERYLLPVSATELVKASRNISENIALFLPRNSNVQQIVKLAGIGKRCEIEHNYLDSRLVAITALYGGEIINKQ